MSGRDLVVVAHRWEATHLPEGTPLLLTGVGMVPAATALARALCTQRPARVVNLGSVGSLRPELTGIQRPRAVINRDLNAADLQAMGVTPHERIELVHGDPDGPVLGTGDGFVAGGPAREALLERCDLVDMEGFAIAHVCAEFDVDLHMIKHVSDAADEGARSWADLVDASARALAAAFASLAEPGQG